MTLENIKSGPEVAQKKTKVAQNGTEKIRKVGKSHVDYWMPRLQKRTYQYEGKRVEVPEFYIRIKHLGRREWFNTATANKTAAADKARRIYLSLISKGWEATMQEFKPDMEVSTDGATVGEFLDQVKATSALKAVTFEIYAKKFRSLIAGVLGIDGGKKKFDYVNGGHTAWQERIHAVKLDALTPERINAWLVNYLKDASKNPVQHRRAQITANSILRSGKSLFTEEIRERLSLKLPDPLPFDGVKNPKLPSMQYRSEIDAASLLQAAKKELGEATGDGAEDKREMFKIVLLSLGVGLRRDEIDTLQCRHILWAKNKIRVETTEHGTVKTEGSEADIHVDPALLDLLKKHLPDPIFPASFVIHSAVKPRPAAATYHHYRCNRMFRLTNQWLKNQGVTSSRAIHTLRKEFGSLINERAGIVAASAALRHSRITTTANHYLDSRGAAVFPLGELLSNKTVTPLPIKTRSKTASKKVA